MLYSLFSLSRSGLLTFWTGLFIVLPYAALILVMLPVHEFAHAYMADKLGDGTARWAGRLSLNPFRHLDVLGTVMLLVAGFGYAKPVPIDPRRFRVKSMQKGIALTAAAGPISNLLMASVSLLIFRIITLVTGESVSMMNGMLYVTSNGIYYAYLVFVSVFAGVNLGLAVFNLLPIPPLDGSRIFGALLPQKWQYTMSQYQPQLTLLCMLLLFTGVLEVPLSFLRSLIGWLLCTVMGLPNYFNL